MIYKINPPTTSSLSRQQQERFCLLGLVEQQGQELCNHLMRIWQRRIKYLHSNKKKKRWNWTHVAWCTKLEVPSRTLHNYIWVSLDSHLNTCMNNRKALVVDFLLLWHTHTSSTCSLQSAESHGGKVNGTHSVLTTCETRLLSGLLLPGDGEHWPEKCSSRSRWHREVTRNK